LVIGLDIAYDPSPITHYLIWNSRRIVHSQFIYLLLYAVFKVLN